MDRFFTLLVTLCVAAGGALAWDRMAPIDYAPPIPFWRPHLRFESLKAQRDGAKTALARAMARRADQSQAATAVTSAIARTLVKTQTIYRDNAAALAKEAPAYVTAEADAQCAVGDGFVRLHDAAALGASAVPEPAGGSVDAPSGLALSAVAATVISNYGVAHEWKAEAEGWRRWYAEQKAVWERAD